MYEYMWLWLVGSLIVVVIVTIYALYKNFDVKIILDKIVMIFNRSSKNVTKIESTVLKKANLKNSSAGDIGGIKSHTNKSDSSLSGSVLDDAKIENSKFGNITGVDVGGEVNRKNDKQE